MSAKEPTADVRLVFEAFTNFIHMLKDDKWLKHGSKEDICNAFESAKTIEAIFEKMRGQEVGSDFEGVITEWLSVNEKGVTLEQLREACETIIEKSLTMSDLPPSKLFYFIDLFTQFCGDSKLEKVVSKVIMQCEVYRVILDYVASGDEQDTAVSISFQAQILKQIWQNDQNQLHLQDTVYEWLICKENPLNIAVALTILQKEVSCSSISRAVESGVAKILCEREAAALQFWSTLEKFNSLGTVLEKFSQLREAVFDYLSSSGDLMEATDDLKWQSGEKGPCGTAGFHGLVASLRCLVRCGGKIAQYAEKFLQNKRNNPGCILWDDIEILIDI